jgi:hypothetical protein
MKAHSKLILLSLIGILVIASCTPQATVPTEDPLAATAAFQALQTQAMQNAQAELTQAALLNPSATPTLLPTNTPETPTATPTATNTAVPPTAVPIIVLPSATPIPYTATPSATATRSDLNCTVTGFSPANGYKLKPGGDFDGRWTIKNTGSATWTTSGTDFAYASGTKFQSHVDVIDLPSEVSNGNSVELIIDMLAPTSTGSYTTTWVLRKDGTNFCYVSLSIVVVE